MPIEINQIIRSKRRTLAIQIKNDGSLIVRAPNRATNTAIREFVEQHQAWIERKQVQARSVVVELPKQFVPGEKFLFLGEAYPLEIVKHQKQPLILDGSFKMSESASRRAELVFERWYREQAREILQERLDWFANQYGFQYQGIKITSAKTRWGSCNAKGALNFSWRLILAPLEQVDYVVVHELAHTVHHNHSKRFWRKVETIVPNYKEHKKWFRKHGPQLMV
ncbi:MAG TPA: SprT family zinc-dependent metalloprotease [Anaerolineales bacterium]|nr:SprT family zinc-dependent metalloprotease [Anaerolineales bacterium]